MYALQSSILRAKICTLVTSEMHVKHEEAGIIMDILPSTEFRLSIAKVE